MSLVFTEEQKLFAETVRQFANEELEPRVKEMVETNKFPRDLYKRAGELGFWRVNIKEELGGLGLGIVESCIVMEELCKVSPAFGLVVEIGVNDLMFLEDNPALHKYLEPCMAGDMVHSAGATPATGQSNAAERSVGAVRDGDDYVLNGTYYYITNNNGGDPMLCEILAKCEDGSIRGFFFTDKTPGYEHTHQDWKLGQAGTGGGTAILTDVRVPAEETIPSGVGLSPFYFIIYTHFGAEALGASEGFLAKTIDYCQNRILNGKPMTQMQVVAHKLAYLQSRVDALHSMVYDCASTYDYLQENPDPALEDEFMRRAESLKVFSGEIAAEVARECMKLYGGIGYHSPEIWHYFGDMEDYSIMDLTTDIHWDQLVTLMHLND